MNSHKSPQNSNFSVTCNHYPHKKCSNFEFSCCNGLIDPCHRCHLERECCDVRPVAVTRITCNECHQSQAPGPKCIHCHIKFSKNYCDICKLFTEADIVHCEHCGFCRVGKKENVKHCFSCDACFDIDGHRCSKVKFTQEKCPTCLESVHTSQTSCVVIPCGHILHESCWVTALEHGLYKCPYCSKSSIDLTRYWKSIKRTIQKFPMPDSNIISVGKTVYSPFGPFLVNKATPVDDDDNNSVDKFLYSGILTDMQLSNGKYAEATFEGSFLKNVKIVMIQCNDCEQITKGPFHSNGLECRNCGSFNTNQK
jgi:hypothetical protein